MRSLRNLLSNVAFDMLILGMFIAAVALTVNHVVDPMTPHEKMHAENGDSPADAHNFDLARPAFLGRSNISYLKNRYRNDSFMQVIDRNHNFVNAMMKARGCGRTWTVVDKSGARFGDGHRETKCNLKWHRTGEFYDGRGHFGQRNRHPG